MLPSGVNFIVGEIVVSLRRRTFLSETLKISDAIATLLRWGAPHPGCTSVNPRRDRSGKTASTEAPTGKLPEPIFSVRKIAPDELATSKLPSSEDVPTTRDRTTRPDCRCRSRADRRSCWRLRRAKTKLLADFESCTVF